MAKHTHWAMESVPKENFDLITVKVMYRGQEMEMPLRALLAATAAVPATIIKRQISCKEANCDE